MIKPILVTVDKIIINIDISRPISYEPIKILYINFNAVIISIIVEIIVITVLTLFFHFLSFPV